MTYPYTLTGPLGDAATLGLVVLQPDETIEKDFYRFCYAKGVALHVTRIPSADTVSPETLTAMEAALPASARLLPAAARFDCVGYACTSGATLIGPERVAALVSAEVETRRVTNPLTASLAAFDALQVRKVSILSPYVDSVAAAIEKAFAAKGLRVPTSLSFGEDVEARVARIDPASIADAALALARQAPTEALFLSCTNLRTFDVIDQIETATGLPVISSNQALLWHMLRDTTALPPDAPGRLFRRP